MHKRTSMILHATLWVVIVALAFVMQVIPLLLILTMFNLAVGVSSTTALVVVPAVLIGSLLVACGYAERRRRNWRPAPIRVDEERHVTMTQNVSAKARGIAAIMENRRRFH